MEPNVIWSEDRIQEHLQRLKIISKNARSRRDRVPHLVSGVQIVIFNPNANKGKIALKGELLLKLARTLKGE